MKKHISIWCCFLCFSGVALSQSTDIIRLEYTQIPENSNGIKTSRYRVLGNFPIALGPEKYIITGLEYNFLDIDVSRTFPFDFSELEQLHIIDFNLGYIFTTVLALLFLTIGAFTVYGTGQVLGGNATQFSNKLLQIFTTNLGEWSHYVIAIAAFG
ncbi:MAG: hypothetical protein AAF361_15465, partial [Bacteroidota bacterium]